MPNYGRTPDRPDERDLVLKMPVHFTLNIPTKADLLTGMDIPVYDQGDEGSCTANAGVVYRRWLYQRFSKTPHLDHDLSRQFLYWEERNLPWNNTVGEDSGASMRDICVVLSKIGVCPETDYPYSMDFRNSPTEKAVHDAASRKIGAYHRITSLNDLKLCMATGPAGYPVLIGFPVYESFERIRSDGKMPIPAANERLLGGHAVFAWGFRDDMFGGSICIQNSWGTGWGDRGHFYMPYAFYETYMRGIDAWMMHLGPPWRGN